MSISSRRSSFGFLDNNEPDSMFGLNDRAYSFSGFSVPIFSSVPDLNQIALNAPFTNLQWGTPRTPEINSLPHFQMSTPRRALSSVPGSGRSLLGQFQLTNSPTVNHSDLGDTVEEKTIETINNGQVELPQEDNDKENLQQRINKTASKKLREAKNQNLSEMQKEIFQLRQQVCDLTAERDWLQKRLKSKKRQNTKPAPAPLAKIFISSHSSPLQNFSYFVDKNSQHVVFRGNTKENVQECSSEATSSSLMKKSFVLLPR